MLAGVDSVIRNKRMTAIGFWLRTAMLRRMQT